MNRLLLVILSTVLTQASYAEFQASKISTEIKTQSRLVLDYYLEKDSEIGVGKCTITNTSEDVLYFQGFVSYQACLDAYEDYLLEEL